MLIKYFILLKKVFSCYLLIKKCKWTYSINYLDLFKIIENFFIKIN